MPVWLFVGLGNPGQRYSATRHNFGFRVIDYLAQGIKFINRYNSLIAKTIITSKEVYLQKPLTYMNNSGQAVLQAVKELSIPVERLLVFCDDLDLPLGRVRLRKGGSSGGHRGLQSIIEHIGRDDFYRFRLGIGRPQGITAAEYVLDNFSAEEEKIVYKVLDVVREAIVVLLDEGPEAVMNRYNGLIIQ